ncbi:MAG: CPBP family intramembrane glutamic endopeptidase [Bacteroidota bacterium]
MSAAVSISDQRRIFEILAVVLTGLGKFVFMDYLNWRLLYIATACLFWMGYVGFRFWQNKATLNYWGLTTAGFGKTFLELLPFAILCILLFWLCGRQVGTNVLSWHILPILLLYPIWGIIQQFIIVGLLARNLQDLKRYRWPFSAIVLSTASVFGIVHYPFWLLIAGTFLLGIVYTILYLKGRNLLVLGLYHAWVGAFFFYTLLARDPWMEVFGKISG